MKIPSITSAYGKFYKCEFWLEEIAFFGHVISKEEQLIHTQKIRAVIEWKRPETVTEEISREKKKEQGVKLPLGLCGCQEESLRNYDEESQLYGEEGQVHDNESQRRTQLPTPLPESSVVVSIDEWQTVRSGSEEIGRWIFNSDEVEFIDWVGPTRACIEGGRGAC
jgi:hypothetical protein